MWNGHSTAQHINMSTHEHVLECKMPKKGRSNHIFESNSVTKRWMRDRLLISYCYTNDAQINGQSEFGVSHVPWIGCTFCQKNRFFFPTNQDRKKTTKMERHTHTKNIKMTIGGCVPVCVCAECNSSKVKSKSKSSADSTESNMKKKPHSFQTDHILLWV